MKTNIFSFNRIGLMFQRYFTERFHTELIYWGIMIIAFMFIRNNIPAMCTLIFIAGIFYAARFFKEIHSPSNGVAYFMIPATQLEKLIVGIIMTTFYYFAMMIITYVIGNLLGTALYNFIINFDFLKQFLPFFIDRGYSPLRWKMFEVISGFPVTFGANSITYVALWFLLFILIQSIYLLGGLYFKRNQPFVTTFSIVAFLILQSTYTSLLIKLCVIGNITDDIINITSIDKISEYVLYGSYYLLIPFFWIVSYFRLTEKQI